MNFVNKALSIIILSLILTNLFIHKSYSQFVRTIEKKSYRKTYVYSTTNRYPIKAYIWDITDSSILILDYPPEKCIYKDIAQDTIILTDNFHDHLIEIPVSEMDKIKIANPGVYIVAFLGQMAIFSMLAINVIAENSDYEQFWEAIMIAGSILPIAITSAIITINTRRTFRFYDGKIESTKALNKLQSYKINPPEFLGKKKKISKINLEP